jgi:hypothetical protein
MDSRQKSSQTEPQPAPNIGPESTGSRNGGRSGSLFNVDSSEHEGEANSDPVRVQVSSGLPVGPTRPQLVRGGGLWVRRLTMALFVAVCVWAGLFLVVFPWTQAWTDNFLLVRNLTLRSLALQNFVRGLVTGLGAVNVWMGIWEAVHYREDEKGHD